MSKKRRLAVFDIETDPFKRDRIPEPFAADFFDGERHRTTWGKDCIADLWEEMAGSGYVIFSHNGGKFDFHYLLPFVDKRFLEIKVIGSALAQMTLPNGTQFRDSYKIIPAPLAAHDKGKIDYDKFEEERRDLHHDEIVDYLRRDNESLYTLVERFVSDYGLGLTIRGRAFSELKKMGWEIPEITRGTDEMIRPFFFGGRVEAFESGKVSGALECFDINSAYPFAMTYSHPWGTEYFVTDEAPDKNFEQSFFTITADSAGAFAKRNEMGGIDFPREHGIFQVTGWELKTAKELKLARNIEIQTAYVPAEVTDFKGYVERFYKMKLEAERAGDKVGRLFAKIFMNSCYGGFAMNPDHFNEYKFTEYDDTMPAPWEIQEIFPDGSLLWKTPSAEEKFYNVGTSASITGFVRAMLLRALVKCENPLYCDTDSIFVKGRARLPVGDALGTWKSEGKGKELHIGGKKIYAFLKNDGEWKCASKGAKLTPYQIKTIAQGKEVTWKSEVPSYSMKKSINFVERKIRNLLTKGDKSLKFSKSKKGNKSDKL